MKIGLCTVERGNLRVIIDVLHLDRLGVYSSR